MHHNRQWRKATISLGSLLMVLLSLVMPAVLQAAPVTQLDITSGSISLMNGTTTLFSVNFTQNGTIVMGQYQPPPNIFAPLTLGPITLSLRTTGPNPAPSGNTTGNAITVDLTSLSAGLTGPLIPSGFIVNIGGNAVGTFNQLTKQFTNLSWNHLLDYNAVLSGHSYQEYQATGMQGQSLVFSFNGTAQIAAVPLPGAALLFLSGFFSIVTARAKRLAV